MNEVYLAMKSKVKKKEGRDWTVDPVTSEAHVHPH